MARPLRFTPWAGSPGVVSTQAGVLQAAAAASAFSGAGSAALTGALAAASQAAAFTGAGSADIISQLASITLLRIDPTAIASTNGTRLTAVTDLSPSGNNGVEALSGRGPVYRDNLNAGSVPCLDFYNFGGSTGALLFTGSSLATAANATNAEFEVIQVSQWLGNSQAYEWSWGSSTTASQYLNLSNSAATTSLKTMQMRGNGSGNVNQSSTRQTPLSVQVISCSRDSGTNTLRIDTDGVAEYSAVQTDIGRACNVYGIGCQSFGSATPTLGTGGFRLYYHIVFSRKLTTPERAALYAFLGAKFSGLGLDRKVGLVPRTATGGTLGIIIGGQSNGVGQGTALTQPSGVKLYQLGCDMRLKDYVEPSGVDTFLPPGLSDNTVSGQSPWSKFVEGARGAGETREIWLANAAVNSTSSTSWNTAITNPTGLVGQLKAKILELARSCPAPFKVGSIIIYQGEVDGNAGPTGSAAHDLWLANWTAILDELNTWVPTQVDSAGNALTWEKTHHFGIVQLYTTTLPAGIGSNGPFIKQAQADLVSGRSDCWIVAAPDSPRDVGGLHLDLGAPNTLGTAAYAAYAAAA